MIFQISSAGIIVHVFYFTLQPTYTGVPLYPGVYILPATV